MDLVRVLLGVILLSLLFARPIAGGNSPRDLPAIAIMGGEG